MEEIRQFTQQREVRFLSQLAPAPDFNRRASVNRLEPYSAVGSGADLGMRAQADGGVQRLCVFMEQI
jgi:hypothetical protein